MNLTYTTYTPYIASFDSSSESPPQANFRTAHLGRGNIEITSESQRMVVDTLAQSQLPALRIARLRREAEGLEAFPECTGINIRILPTDSQDCLGDVRKF
jgi:hypothetical protein